MGLDAMVLDNSLPGSVAKVFHLGRGFCVMLLAIVVSLKWDGILPGRWSLWVPTTMVVFSELAKLHWGYLNYSAICYQPGCLRSLILHCLSMTCLIFGFMLISLKLDGLLDDWWWSVVTCPILLGLLGFSFAIVFRFWWQAQHWLGWIPVIFELFEVLEILILVILFSLWLDAVLEIRISLMLIIMCWLRAIVFAFVWCSDIYRRSKHRQALVLGLYSDTEDRVSWWKSKTAVCAQGWGWIIPSIFLAVAFAFETVFLYTLQILVQRLGFRFNMNSGGHYATKYLLPWILGKVLMEIGILLLNDFFLIPVDNLKSGPPPIYSGS